MVDYPIGDLIAERVRRWACRPFYKRFEHDGVARPEHGHRLQRPRPRRARRRSSSTTAATRPAALLKPGDFDWAAIFAGGVRWFHSGGIFAALSETTAELIIEAMQAAKAARRGRLVRPELPREALERRRAAQTRAVEVLGRIVEHVDVLVGNEEDLQKGLGIPGPEVAAKSEARSRARSSA